MTEKSRNHVLVMVSTRREDELMILEAFACSRLKFLEKCRSRTHGRGEKRS